MANLLTPEQKKHTTQEHKLRIAVVILWFVFATVFIAGVFLLPIYILTQSRKEFNGRQVMLLDELIDRREKSDVQTEVRATKVKMDLLANVIDDITALEVFESIISTRGSFVTIDDISYSHTTKDSATVALVGTAENRSELLSFTKRLEREPLVESVELPVSNLVQSFDIPFSIFLVVMATEEEV